MKNQKMVTYIKNGKEIQKEFKLFTKKEILNTLFNKEQIQSECCEFYKINEDIEYLLLQNITFKRNLRFIIPKNTLVILEDCTFKGSQMELINGSIELIHPNLNPCYYTNRIYLSDLDDFNMIVSNENKGYITVTGSSQNFTLDTKDRIDSISIKANNAYLKNIKEIKSLKITGKETTLANCKIDMNLENNNQKIETEELNINDSNLYYYSDFEIMNISAEHIFLKNSHIYFSGNELINGTLQSKEIELKNSTLEAKRCVNFQCETLKMDKYSKIKSKDNITILQNTYSKKEKEKEVELNLKNYTYLESRSSLISILKGIKKELTEEPVIERKNSKIKSKKR